MIIICSPGHPPRVADVPAVGAIHHSRELVAPLLGSNSTSQIGGTRWESVVISARMGPPGRMMSLQHLNRVVFRHVLWQIMPSAATREAPRAPIAAEPHTPQRSSDCAGARRTRTVPRVGLRLRDRRGDRPCRRLVQPHVLPALPDKSDLWAASARRRYGAVCDEMERRPRFESTFTALCESFIKGAEFDPPEAELGALQRRLLQAQPDVAKRLREGAEPMGDRLTSIVAQRLEIDPGTDITADLMVRLVRSAARSAEESWLMRAATSELVDEHVLIESMREAFGAPLRSTRPRGRRRARTRTGTRGARMSDRSLEVQSVSHAGVVVADVDTVGDFFEEVLGLRRLYRIDVDDKILVGFAVDDMLVELIQYPDDDPMRFRATGTARMHLGFTVRNFDRRCNGRRPRHRVPGRTRCRRAGGPASSVAPRTWWWRSSPTKAARPCHRAFLTPGR